MTSIDAWWTREETAAGKSTRWERLEHALDRGSEWLNPILVKEARQALKSRQFVVTFGMLLLFGWAWTLLGVVLSAPGIFYGAEGKGMLYGYFLVLAVPLLVVVPFSAFRSLASEREDGTYELISITALNARQIVTGKLGSAVLQMMVYFSALAPCVAFTYLLRGVDIFSIFFVLYYTFIVSLLLSSLGLVVATAARSRHWQTLLSVLLLLLLFIAALLWVWFVWVTLSEEVWRADLWEFWAVQGGILSLAVTYLLLFMYAAAAQISFASDNRSTRLRYVMLAQAVLWIGWMTFLWQQVREAEVAVGIVIAAGIHWLVMGALMIGEYPQLSPRVRRELPQSALGRMFLTCLNPGSGTGYLFAVGNLWATGLVLLVLLAWLYIAGDLSLYAPPPGTIVRPWVQQSVGSSMWATTLICAYVTGYLGVSRLLVLAARQVASVGLMFSVLITAFLVIAGMALPWIFQYWLFEFRSEEYTPLQVTNWMWTVGETLNHDITAHPVVLWTVFGCSFGIFLVNLLLAGKEISQGRLAAPARVVEDEAALHPVVIKKRSPWDDEPSEAELPPGT